MEEFVNSKPPSDDERWVAETLQPIDQDLPALPSELLEKVGALAARLHDQPADHQASPSPSNPNHQRSWRTMIQRIGLTAVAAAALLLVLLKPSNPASGVTLGSVLDSAFSARTLQLKVHRDGKSADVWLTLPGRMRWQDSPTEYQITAGAHWWRIDESTNSVESGRSPWYRNEQNPVDLLSLLGVSQQASSEFRRVATTEQIEHDGRMCHVFRLSTAIDDRPLRLEAFADAVTGQLLTITAWPNGPRQGTPLAELRLVARDIPVQEEMFVVARTLSHDGRVAKVKDRQGVVSLRPLASDRWTLVTKQMLVKPGDWVRTALRGAHAVSLASTNDFTVTAGPGSVIEWLDGQRVRLHRGEVRVQKKKADKQGEAGETIQLLGPKGKSVTVSAGQTQHMRITDGDWVEVSHRPRWLDAFDGTSAVDPLGSLVCNVNNQSTSLSVGYHHVNVEIRDQIARTTIEESFVNHTDEILEGTFHFPLPQDASISGFGMWINGELVEADVVEKQRAREIYETILRERRDPGLLEWTGGNVFKARVFPIPAHQEKRIRIVYTQVLPMRANRFRYSYGLKSELLQQNPLRELSLNVLVHSALPLKDVSCRTHECRTQQTEHSAKLEFVAEDFSPDRDFEVTGEVNSQNADVVVVPHRRGDDGYFLVQFTPPAGQGNWQRELLPDGEPLRVMLVCDTSGSMDHEGRRRQREFVTAVLDSLGAKDRFNVSVTDVDCTWLFDNMVEPNDKNRNQVIDALHERVSLGWTDLDRMVESVDEQLGGENEGAKSEAATHVVYIGDGIVTAHDVDPQRFAGRLQAKDDQTKATFHAVSVGSRFESTVLRAMAGIGGGSVRQLSDQQTPEITALELLNEIAQPAISDLQVEFRGVQAAAVYPRQLPNVPAGVQQILVGRYLPTGEEQSGEIIVSGERNGERVRYATRIQFDDAESGNSFIPRLWARAHLDELLSQGSGPMIQDDVIALSEEFHIITPYTSLLVLESDADRERFGVQRRFLMRDGERFFADGRDQARFELLQQQRKLAGDWRLGMRRNVLQQFAKLGRNPKLFQQWKYRLQQDYDRLTRNEMVYWSGAVTGGTTYSRGIAGGGINVYDFNGRLGDTTVDGELLGWDGDGLSSFDGLGIEANFGRDFGDIDGTDFYGEYDMGRSVSFGLDAQGNPTADLDLQFRQEAFAFNAPQFGGFDGGLAGLTVAGRSSLSQFSPSHYRRRPTTTLFSALFPVPPRPVVAPKAEPKPDWPVDALALSESVRQALEFNGGIEVDSRTEHFQARWKRKQSSLHTLTLYSATQWLQATQNDVGDPRREWCDSKHRGVYSEAFEFGRRRKVHSTDLKSFAPGSRPYSRQPLYHMYRNYKASVERPSPKLAVLTLQYEAVKSKVVIQFDTEKHVVRSVVQHTDGKVTSQEKYTNFTKLAGVWWPRTLETLDGDSRRTAITRQRVKLLTDAEFDLRYQQEFPQVEEGVLDMPLPSEREAEVAAAQGADAAEDQLVLLIKASSTQDWDAVMRHLAALEQHLGDAAGRPWLRATVQIAARKNEAARQVLQALSKKLSDRKTTGERFLVDYLLGQLGQIADVNERLDILDSLAPVYQRQPDSTNAELAFHRHRIPLLNSVGRSDEAIEIQRADATEYPWNVSLQTQYAQALVSMGRVTDGRNWLRQEIAREEHASSERHSLRQQLAEMLRSAGEAEQLVDLYRTWTAEQTDVAYVYVQYLNAIALTNDADGVNSKIAQWMKEGREQDSVSPSAKARLQAAYRYALGNRYHYNKQWLDPDWIVPLQELARYFVEHEDLYTVSSEIIQNHRFRDTDECDSLLQSIADKMDQHVRAAHPRRLSLYLTWTLSQTSRATEGYLSVKQWGELATQLKTRWEQEEDWGKREALGNGLIQIYQKHFRDTHVLPFWRERIAYARQHPDAPQSAARAAQWSSSLFHELLNRKWQAEHEAEAIQLIEQLSADTWPSQQLGEQIFQLHQFVDRMIQNRITSDARDLQDQEHPETMTRPQLAKRAAEFRADAQAGVAATLQEYEGSVKSDVLKEWVQAERMYLDLRLERDLRATYERCWALLGESPQMVDEDGATLEEDGASPYGPFDETTDKNAINLIRQWLRQRLLTMVEYQSVRKSAPKPWANQVLKYIDVGVAFPGDNAMFWKQERVEMLVALDDVEQLQRDLSQWIRADIVPTSWQIMLGKIYAEQGKFRDAIGVFESIQRRSTLPASAYAALSQWYLVEGERELHDEAKVARFTAMPEYQIRQWIRQQQRRWERDDQPLPSELDEEVLFAFQALFRKSAHPGNYLDELARFYGLSKDFRLMKVLPASLTGRTPQEVYSFLGSMSYVLDELREEATADELLAAMMDLRSKTDSPIDLRAVDLIEVLVEHRAARQINQPGPHADAALAAMRRAFDHAWADGEPKQMSHVLRNLGSLQQTSLREERQREFLALAAMEEDPEDRFHIRWQHAYSTYWHDKNEEQGLQLMEAAVAAVDATLPNGWPQRLHSPMSGWMDMLIDNRRLSTAEQILLKQRTMPMNQGEWNWFYAELDDIYLNALRASGRVSIGADEILLINFEKQLLARMEVEDDLRQRNAIESLFGAYLAAHQRTLPVKDRTKQFLFKTLPRFLKSQSYNYYSQLVSRGGQVANEVLGPRDALEFIVLRFENYPPGIEMTGNTSWRAFASYLGDYRVRAGEIPRELESRVLAIVLDELRRDLRTRYRQSRVIYQEGHSYYRKEMKPEFIKTAEKVLKERPRSARNIAHVATYLHDALSEVDRAIEILQEAQKQQLLNINQQLVLVTYLQNRTRHLESIAILEPIVEIEPDTMSHRSRLLRAYFHSSKPARFAALLKSTDAHFRQQGRWQARSIFDLAEACLDTKEFASAAGYYREAIGLQKRFSRAGKNGLLASYYVQLARAYIGLGDTVQAVDAASAAIVIRNNDKDDFDTALSVMRTALAESKDLPAFVRHHDNEVKKTGLDSPMLRQKLGEVFASQREHGKAIEQFQKSLDLRPRDTTTRQSLIEAYGAIKDYRGMVRETLVLIDSDRHALSHYTDLVNRMTAAANAEQAEQADIERARTTIVEAAPHEAEYHAELATIREAEGQWKEAIIHWKHVARLRALEPNGLQKLAAAQLRDKQWNAARETLQKLQQTSWPSRFRDEVQKQLRQLLPQLPKEE